MAPVVNHHGFSHQNVIYQMLMEIFLFINKKEYTKYPQIHPQKHWKKILGSGQVSLQIFVNFTFVPTQTKHFCFQNDS